jgi:hypothetical protein
MSYSVIVYPDPLNAKVTLTPDYSGADSVGTPYTHTDGRQGQLILIPDDVPDEQGAEINVEATGFVPLNLRGFLKLDQEEKIARLQVDDYNLIPDGNYVPPVEPPDHSGKPPDQIVMDVYNDTHPNLTTKEGCGKFTEDVCTALHNDSSRAWGHVTKTGGQNQWNGHAVDAVMLLGNIPGCQAGTYDIIFSSESWEAKPVFNYAGPPDPNIWHYPAGVYRIGAAGQLQAVEPRELKAIYGER